MPRRPSRTLALAAVINGVGRVVAVSMVAATVVTVGYEAMRGGPGTATAVLSPATRHPTGAAAPSPRPLTPTLLMPSTVLSPAPAPTPRAGPTTPAASPTTPSSPPATPSTDTSGELTAAARYGWTGKLLHGDDFTEARLDPSWEAYDTGAPGEGRHSPAVGVRDGVLRLSSGPDGTTSGLAWRYSQTYGRWEARVRVSAGCTCFRVALVLWPDGQDGVAADGELDYLEVVDDPARQQASFVLRGGGRRIEAHRHLDVTAWHTYAVEVAPDHVTGYVDGEPWFQTTARDAIPRLPVHQTLQLERLPGQAPGETAMEVDWVRMYGL